MLKAKNINAQTSTFPSEHSGANGDRAPITYYGSKSNKPTGTELKINFTINNKKFSVRTNGIIPKTYDYIIYSDDNIIYLLYIVSAYEKDPYTYDSSINILDSWVTYEKNEINSEDYSNTIKVNYFNKKIKYKKISEDLFDNNLSEISSVVNLTRNVVRVIDDTVNPDEWISYNDAQICLAFQVYTKNNTPIGRYKITIEFNTEWQSPAVDNMVSNKFALPTDYAKYNKENFRKKFIGYNENNQPILGNPGFTPSDTEISKTNEDLTFRGYLSNYTMGYKDEDIDHNIINGCLTENFDDEKLDNFEIVIKNYDDGVGLILFNSDVFIPNAVLLNALAKDTKETEEETKSKRYKYRCNLYIYIENTNGTIDKAFLGDFTDEIYDVIKKSYEYNERILYKTIQQKSSYTENDEYNNEIIINNEYTTDQLPGNYNVEPSSVNINTGDGNNSNSVLITPGGKVIVV